MTARIIDAESGRHLPLHETGIVLFRGANVFEGYLDDPEKTAAAFRDGWFVTGDLGRFDQEGFLIIEGRLSRFSKVASHFAKKEEDAARGLLAGVNAVTQTADAAVLLCERAMFFAQRAPFLFRLQARVGAYEIARDGVRQLAGQAKLIDRTEDLLNRTNSIVEKSTALMEQTGQLEPMLRELTQLTENATVVTREARLLNASLTPLTERLAARSTWP